MKSKLLCCALLCAATFTGRAQAQKVDPTLTALLQEFEHVEIQQHGEVPVLTGWVRDETERARLDRVLARMPEVLYLTASSEAARDHMIEVDVVIVVVNETETRSFGFDFLQLVNFNYTYFKTDHQNLGTNFITPSSVGTISNHHQYGSLLSASVDYDVNIANATDESASIVARPHLTTLSGEQAQFLSGGEIIFKVSGINSGDIKPYAFGIQLDVTPTVLPSEDEGVVPVMLDVQASRTSVLGRLLTTPTNDDVNFDKTLVRSKALLNMNETLVLSGLYQREYRKRNSGVPYLRDIPLIRLFFSNEIEIDDVQSTVIFLTPRDPKLVNEETQKEISDFIERRKQYVEAVRTDSPDDVAKFEADYPDWFKPQPNSFATHIFMRERNSCCGKRAEGSSAPRPRHEVIRTHRRDIGRDSVSSIGARRFRGNRGGVSRDRAGTPSTASE
jgi:hypothetical protein